MVSPRIIRILICIAVILLITCTVSAGLGLLLDALNDQVVANTIFQVITGGCGLLLLVDLICLVLALAVNSLESNQSKPGRKDNSVDLEP